MDAQEQSMLIRAALPTRVASTPVHKNLISFSSPAFGTPVLPSRPPNLVSVEPRPKPIILPVFLPPATLRPLAFRIFTKKHSLTLSSTALQALATFVGNFCGAGWKEEGLAEKVLEEAAKRWELDCGGLIVDGDGSELKRILQKLEGSMNGGRLAQPGTYSTGENSVPRGTIFDKVLEIHGDRSEESDRTDSLSSLSLPRLEQDGNEDRDHEAYDPRQWLKVVGAFDQPRLVYNANQKHFEKDQTVPSLFPDPAQKTHLFRRRYNLLHQRLLRNESFQIPTIAMPRNVSLLRSSSTTTTQQQAYKLTPIANLLGRSGSNHVLLGLLTISPAGNLAVSDLTGSIALDIEHARPIPENGAWFTPGMVVIVDGIYEEEGFIASSSVEGGGGVGGTIGGRFIGLSIGGPPCERRETTLGISSANSEGDITASGGFGWTDFLGVGSERSSGPGMRELEKKVIGRHSRHTKLLGRGKIVIIGELNLYSPKTFQALRKIFDLYAGLHPEDLPMAFVLTGNFVQHAVMAGGGSGGSIEYKEYVDCLASLLSDYPTILQAATFVFVPGDNDPWASAFSAGASSIVPRRGLPELFTSRIKRAFTSANVEVEKVPISSLNGEPVWTSNPARLTLFGPAQEIVVFRDDISSRIRRSAIHFQATDSAKSVHSKVQPAAQDADSTAPIEQSRMDVDKDIVAAESHMPFTKRTEVTTSTLPDDLISARKLVKTILDQGHLSPFPLSTRPVLWDFAGALHLYPLPTALVLVDPDAPPFTITYEGCHVMNPGQLVADSRKGLARCIEYDASTKRGKIRETTF